MSDSLGEDPDFSIPVGIVHGNCLEEAENLAKMIKEQTLFTNTIINDISPSIGTHSGPGAIGIIFYGDLKPAAKESK